MNGRFRECWSGLSAPASWWVCSPPQFAPNFCPFKIVRSTHALRAAHGCLAAFNRDCRASDVSGTLARSRQSHPVVGKKANSCYPVAGQPKSRSKPCAPERISCNHGAISSNSAMHWNPVVAGMATGPNGNDISGFSGFAAQALTWPLRTGRPPDSVRGSATDFRPNRRQFRWEPKSPRTE